MHHTYAPLFTVVEPGLWSNCRQLPEKAILRTQRDVVLQFRQKLRADEQTRTADLPQLRVRFRLLYVSRKVAYLQGKRSQRLAALCSITPRLVYG